MSGGSQGGPSNGGGGVMQMGDPGLNGTGSYGVNLPQAGYGPSAPTSAQQIPQWLQGMRLGQQFAQTGLQAAQAGQRPAPQMPPMQRPMMGAGMPGGMPQSVVPGSQPQQPMGPGMASGGMGMPQGGPPMSGAPGINPQLLQMLMRGRQ